MYKYSNNSSYINYIKNNSNNINNIIMIILMSHRHMDHWKLAVQNMQFHRFGRSNEEWRTCQTMWHCECLSARCIEYCYCLLIYVLWTTLLPLIYTFQWFVGDHLVTFDSIINVNWWHVKWIYWLIDEHSQLCIIIRHGKHGWTVKNLAY